MSRETETVATILKYEIKGDLNKSLHPHLSSPAFRQVLRIGGVRVVLHFCGRCEEVRACRVWKVTPIAGDPKRPSEKHFKCKRSHQTIEADQITVKGGTPMFVMSSKKRQTVGVGGLRPAASMR